MRKLKHRGLGNLFRVAELVVRFGFELDNLTSYLHDPDNHDGMITQLEPDILDCEVKWALGNITMNTMKLVEVMGFQSNCFKS